MSRSYAVLSVLALAAASGSAAPADAGISLYRWNVPDFDQRRAALPGDGDMHCVPTSAVNWTAYIANHGFAPIMFGARNWQDNANYAFVTQNIDTMGTFMNTDPVDGTGGNDGLNGLKLFLLTRAPYQFTATKWYGNITPFDVFNQMATNGLISACYGYYKQLPNVPSGFFYARDGGHCVSLNGLQNMFSTSDPVFRLRDPADEADYFSQGAFATVSCRVAPESFDSTVTPGGTVTRTRMLDFGTNSTTRRYLDSMYVIRANFSCWAPATTNPQVTVSKVASLFGDPQPQHVSFSLAPGAVASAIALHPDLSKAVVVESSFNAAGPAFRKKLFNLADGSSTDLGLLLPAVGGKTPVAFDRFGHLIECDGSVLKSWDISGPAPVLVRSTNLPSPASSVDFDDSSDQVVIYTPSDRRIRRYQSDFTPVAGDPIPTEIPITNDGTVIPSIGGLTINQLRWLFASPTGDPVVYELGLVPGTTRFRVESSLLLPAVQRIEGLQQGDGGVFFALCDGSVRAIDRDPASGRLRIAPTQPYANLPLMRSMNISRSRTNFQAELHSGPAWRNLPNPDEGVTPVPDCIADYNLSGTVTVQDIFDFLADYFAGNPHADVNGSASITVQDIFDFLSAYFRGC